MKLKLKARANRSDARTIRHALEQLSAKGSVRKAGDEFVEQRIREGKQAVKMTRLSCHRFRSNQVRLALSLLAYNPGNVWRRLVKHARYYWVLLTKGRPNRRRFGAMLGRIALLQVPTG